LQKREKPPPVPEMPTVTLTPVAPARLKSSAAAVVYGPTVDDPSAVIEPVSFFRLYVGPAVEPAIAVDTTTVATNAPAAKATPRRPNVNLIVFPSPRFDFPCHRDGRGGRCARGATRSERRVLKW